MPSVVYSGPGDSYGSVQNVLNAQKTREQVPGFILLCDLETP